MLIDTEQLEGGTRIEATVAIVGGGIAGIVLALELGAAGIDVAIIESGDERPSERQQDLYAGSCTLRVGDDNAIDVDEYLIKSRFREFGGSGNYWGGKCSPLDPFDFQRKEWIAHSGWPIDRAQLDPFYERACKRLELPSLAGTTEAIFGSLRSRLLGGSKELAASPYCFTRYIASRRINSYPELRRRVAEHPRIKVYLKANAMRVRLRRDGSVVDAVEARCFNDRRHSVHAKSYVLAAGGIENARILLASDDVQRTGVGNHSDWLGRGFQIHAGLTEGDRTSAALFRAQQEIESLFERRNDRPYAVIGPSEAMQRRLRTADLKVTFRRIGRAGGRDSVAINTLARRLTSSASMTSCEIYFGIEHTPNRESRLTLARDRVDPLGMPRVRLRIQMSGFDVESFVRSSRAMALEMGRLDLGRLPSIKTSTELAHVVRFGMARHHMGATRMSRTPSSGVVNENCRVHGVQNLFVAGSSVFPTSGTANPTLTIVALAMRLGDHIRSEAVRTS